MSRGPILSLGLAVTVACTAAPITPATGDTAATPTAPTTCEDGVPARPFSTEPGGVLFGERAADFTVETLDKGAFTLSEAWNGCDSFVIVTYFEGPAGDALWSSDPTQLLENAPRNSQFLFVSDEAGPARRQERLEALQTAMNLGPRRAERVHFVLDRFSRIEGGLGDFARDYLAYVPGSLEQIDDERAAPAPLPAFLGIDRDQAWDSGGATYDVVGNSGLIEMAGWLPHFYNHKATLDHRLATEADVTEVMLVDQEVTERVFDVAVDLPSDLSAFDTLEIDVSVTCNARNPFACSEWDRIARIEWCADATCEDRREIARWITPYWRRGTRRWAIDASPFLGLVGGGTQSFRIVMGPPWERATPRDARMALRLSTRGVPRATSVERVFTGGAFNESYNDNHPPVTFDVPAGATRVELVSILSGHGQDPATNCAEWCDHRHTFAVGDQTPIEIRPEGAVGQSLDCAPQAAQGVPPGQYGNWAPLRAYWCPGLPVTPIVHDLTGLVAPGSSAELSYSATFSNGVVDVPSPGGNIDLSTYIVVYE